MYDLGYSKPLYIMPFDHRSTFTHHMLNIVDRQPTEDEIKRIIEMKQIIYEGFKNAVSEVVPKDHAAMLIDEQFGNEIILNALSNKYIIMLPTEKSGQDEFDFEYSEDFAEHIEKYKPTFVKALVRYNPEGNPEMNRRQKERLKILSNYTHQHQYKLLAETLIPPTEQQLLGVNNDKSRYDLEIRPQLEVEVIKEFQNNGIEPDVWKIEGMEEKDQYEQLIKQARTNGREQVGIVVLGRGADSNQVEQWLLTGAQVEGVIGFAVGRTVFWEPLVSYKDGETEKEQAVEQIAKNYIHFYHVFTSAKKGHM